MWGMQVIGLFSFPYQSMFAVGWLELKEPERAQQLLSKCFSNITEPFKVRQVEAFFFFVTVFLFQVLNNVF